MAGEDNLIGVGIFYHNLFNLATMVGDLELVAQTVNIQRTALIQVVRRPGAASVNARAYDPDSSGEYGLVYTRFVYCPRSDSFLDASDGQILDVRVSTADIEARLARHDREDFIARHCTPQLTEEQQELVDLADDGNWRHGVAPERITSPVSFLNLTTQSGVSTLYVEEEEISDISGIQPANSAYDYVEVVNQEEEYDRAYSESFYINYSVLNNARDVGEEVGSSWSHVSGTSLLASRPWPKLPSLPSSSSNENEGGVIASNDVKREPTTPTNWTELMEGSFMASLDCQQSPESGDPGLEAIIPVEPNQRSFPVENDHVSTRPRRIPGNSASDHPRGIRFEEPANAQLPSNTVEMPTAPGPINVTSPTSTGISGLKRRRLSSSPSTASSSTSSDTLPRRSRRIRKRRPRRRYAK